MQASFHKISVEGKVAKMVPVREHRQCLLCFCNLPEGRLRVLDCIGSLYKTHKGILLPIIGQRRLFCFATGAKQIKKLLHAITDRSCP